MHKTTNCVAQFRYGKYNFLSVMAENKDRFGKKMREREKAEEDQYFARKDREKLAKLREKSAAAPELGLCPKCGVALEATDHLGVTVDVCAQCGGVWLDKGELEAVEQRDEEGWPSTWFRSILSGNS